MMELTIFEKRGQLYTDSREVAEMIEQRYRDLLRSIRHYCEVIANQRKIALVDYFAETDYFSTAYIDRFYEMERALIERQSPQWQQARLEGKKTRRMETDAIKAFVAYATAAGSKSRPYCA